MGLDLTILIVGLLQTVFGWSIYMVFSRTILGALHQSGDLKNAHFDPVWLTRPKLGSGGSAATTIVHERNCSLLCHVDSAVV
jgi:hypothetical protein